MKLQPRDFRLQARRIVDRRDPAEFRIKRLDARRFGFAALNGPLFEVLEQAGVSILSQANAEPQAVLKLLG